MTTYYERHAEECKEKAKEYYKIKKIREKNFFIYCLNNGLYERLPHKKIKQLNITRTEEGIYI